MESSLVISSFTTNKSPFSETVLSVLMNVLQHLCVSLCHINADECVSLISVVCV